MVQLCDVLANEILIGVCSHLPSREAANHILSFSPILPLDFQALPYAAPYSNYREIPFLLVDLYFHGNGATWTCRTKHIRLFCLDG